MYSTKVNGGQHKFESELSHRHKQTRQQAQHILHKNTSWFKCDQGEVPLDANEIMNGSNDQGHVGGPWGEQLDTAWRTLRIN
jgi:hypothetical protein